jgi:hypothetical protein
MDFWKNSAKHMGRLLSRFVFTLTVTLNYVDFVKIFMRATTRTMPTMWCQLKKVYRWVENVWIIFKGVMEFR